MHRCKFLKILSFLFTFFTFPSPFFFGWGGISTAPAERFVEYFDDHFLKFVDVIFVAVGGYGCLPSPTRRSWRGVLTCHRPWWPTTGSCRAAASSPGASPFPIESSPNAGFSLAGGSNDWLLIGWRIQRLSPHWLEASIGFSLQPMRGQETATGLKARYVREVIARG